jgi:hypothetical protein
MMPCDELIKNRPMQMPCGGSVTSDWTYGDESK